MKEFDDLIKELQNSLSHSKLGSSSPKDAITYTSPHQYLNILRRIY